MARDRGDVRSKAMAQRLSAADKISGAKPDPEKLAADDVQALTIRGCGHHPAEETPEATLTALTAFLAPYRDGLAAARNPGRPAAGSSSGRGMPG